MPAQTTSSFAESTAGAADRGAVPGLWPAAAMAVFSTALCLGWLMSADAVATGPATGAMRSESSMAEVAAPDLDAALATMDGSTGFLAQFKATAQGCRRKLAQLTLTGAAGAKVRLRSGGYHSPEFVLTAAPVRVALPFPAPYEIGHGELEILHVGAASVALLPPWLVPAPDGMARHEVTWLPGPGCEPPHG